MKIAPRHCDLEATSSMSPHGQVEGMTMADRIVALNGGATQQRARRRSACVTLYTLRYTRGGLVGHQLH